MNDPLSMQFKQEQLKLMVENRKKRESDSLRVEDDQQ